MSNESDPQIHLIPLNQITIVNPRERGQKKFKQIVDNIARLGLKKPITVTPKESKNGTQKYYLVCGQGRYEAFKILEEEAIPAIIVHVTKQKLLLMSLVENLARRQHSTVELVGQIGILRDGGYTFAQVAGKTDLDVSYVRGICKLLKNGEERLLQAVEKGQLPISVALTIVSSDDHAIQRALTEAYEANTLRGKKLLAARRLIEQRRTDGKAVRKGRNSNGAPVSSGSLLKTYREETARQRLVIQKAKLCETRLLFVVASLKQLFGDDNFVNLLRAETLNTLPSYLSAQINGIKESA